MTFFFIACTDQAEKNAINSIDQEFKSCLESVTSNSEINSEIYMVIPRAGCSACISSAEDFMLTTLKDSSRYDLIQFILTDFDSKKMLRARFGDIINSKNLIIDDQNVFKSNKSLSSIYPTIYFFNKNSRLTHISSISPNEDGLTKLANYLN